MMTSLKVVVVAICILQTAGSSSSLRGDAAEPRELMGGSASSSAGAQPSPGSAGASIPAPDATDEAPANHQAKEATNSEKSENSPWADDDIVTLYTVLGVLFLIFGLGLSVTVYMVSKREEKTPLRNSPEATPQAEADASKVVMELSLDQKYVVDDSASTQAGSQSPSRRTSHDYGSDAPAPVQEQ